MKKIKAPKVKTPEQIAKAEAKATGKAKAKADANELEHLLAEYEQFIFLTMHGIQFEQERVTINKLHCFKRSQKIKSF